MPVLDGFIRMDQLRLNQNDFDFLLISRRFSFFFSFFSPSISKNQPPLFSPFPLSLFELFSFLYSSPSSSPLLLILLLLLLPSPSSLPLFPLPPLSEVAKDQELGFTQEELILLEMLLILLKLNKLLFLMVLFLLLFRQGW